MRVRRQTTVSRGSSPLRIRAGIPTRPAHADAEFPTTTQSAQRPRDEPGAAAQVGAWSEAGDLPLERLVAAALSSRGTPLSSWTAIATWRRAVHVVREMVTRCPPPATVMFRSFDTDSNRWDCPRRCTADMLAYAYNDRPLSGPTAPAPLYSPTN